MNTPASNPDGSGRYELRLRGRLDPRWSARLEGMTLTIDGAFTVLTGHVVDQAALHGLLHQLRDIGLPLVSVHLLDTEDGTRTSHHPEASTTGA